MSHRSNIASNTDETRVRPGEKCTQSIPLTLREAIEQFELPLPSGDKLPFSESEVYGSIGKRFDFVASEVPDNIAVSFEGVQASYKELRGFVEVVSKSMETTSKDDTSPVALYGSTSIPMIAAVFACFKLGRPYLFIHPDLPDPRIVHLLNETDCSCVVYGPEYDKVPLVFRESEFQNRLATIRLPFWNEQFCDGDWTESTARPDSVAYVLYTSGSTGTPKGVAQSHHNVLADIQRQSHDLLVTQDDRYGLLFPLGSSAAICHLGGALLNGATVCPLDMTRANLHEMIDWLNRESISILDINVSTFRQLDGLLQGEQLFPHLRILAPGSEPVHRVDFEIYAKHFSDRCIFQNAFGTSETRTVTQYYMHRTDTPVLDNEKVTIGVPVRGKDVLILDEDGLPVEGESIGEMVIRSRSIATEYWNLPEVSADRFATDPNDPAYTLYHTLDLVKRDENGFLFHLERKDLSRKIHGYFVDFSEIESALRKVPGVQDVVAISYCDAIQTERIAAYVIPSPGTEFKTDFLRDFLLEQIPKYMIPSVFRIVSEFPYLLNQKLDRVRLIELIQAEEAASLDDEDSGNRFSDASPWEERIGQEWIKVLRRSDLTLRDDFASVGGDSLSALRLFAGIESRHGVSFTAVDVFEAFTISSMAAKAERIAGDSKCEVEQPYKYIAQLRSGKKDESVYFIPGGWGGDPEILVFAGLARKLSSGVRVQAIRSRAMDDREDRPDYSERTLRDHVAEVLQEIEACEPSGSEITLVGECVAAVVAMEFAAQIENSGFTIKRVILLDPEMPDPRRRFFRRTSSSHEAGIPREIQKYYDRLKHSPVPRISSDLHLITSSDFSKGRRAVRYWKRKLNGGRFFRYEVGGTHESFIRDESEETVEVLNSILNPH